MSIYWNFVFEISEYQLEKAGGLEKVREKFDEYFNPPHHKENNWCDKLVGIREDCQLQFCSEQNHIYKPTPGYVFIEVEPYEIKYHNLDCHVMSRQLSFYFWFKHNFDVLRIFEEHDGDAYIFTIENSMESWFGKSIQNTIEDVGDNE